MCERAALAALALAVGCADPCADLDAPALALGSSDAAATRFEPFEDGAPLPLVAGPQGGMHVWLSLRLTGLCMEHVRVERRIVDDATEEIVELQRGPLRFVEGDAPDTWVTAGAIPMILCPTTRSVVGERFRFAVRAEDSLGRSAVSMRPFVAACVEGACELCDPL
ncbi:MAG: hypothetical protein KF729_19865 [Sandaracinaceae bacterium]|nr:hypothetical protein [Sandaracinaceae bacterium]